MSKKILKSSLALILSCLLIGGFFNYEAVKITKAAVEGDVVINELMWMGSSASSKDEWIELKNITSQDIDISGWQLTKKSAGQEKLMLEIPEGTTIKAGAYFLISRYDPENEEEKENTILDVIPDLINSSLSLVNSNLQIKLYDGAVENGANLIDVADDGLGTPLAGRNGSPKASMERNEDPSDGTKQENWHTATSSSGFKQESDDLGTPGQKNSQENQTPEIISAKATPSSIPADGKTLVKFEVEVEDPDGLDDIDQVLIDLSEIEGESDQEMSDEEEDGIFVFETTVPLSIKKGTYNFTAIVLDSEKNEAEVDISLKITSPIYSDKIIVNEFLPNPSGSESNDEYIELKNTGSSTVDLEGWKIGDESSSLYTISSKDLSSTMLAAGAYLVIYRSISKIALNNTNDTVKLYWPDGTLADSISYQESAPEDQSYSLEDGTWYWSTTLTPGAKNEITLENHPPEAVAGPDQKAYLDEKITFDGSDSFDPDEDRLSFSWDFGDGMTGSGEKVTHAYSEEGVFTVTLTVEDEKGESDKDTLKAEITAKEEEEEEEKEDKKEQKSYPENIIISELMPNPEGSDSEGEWIEIQNQENTSVDLTNWRLDDEENGSSAYTIPKGTEIKAGEFLVFYRTETKIALNNDSDSVRLFNPNDDLVSEIVYKEKAEEGYAYARNSDGTFAWTKSPTPGEENLILEPEEEDEDKEEESKKEENQEDKEEAQKQQKKEQEKEGSEENPKTLSISQIKLEEKNTWVKTSGIVTCPPGVISSLYFYIQDESSGIQIYFSKKDFSNLLLGDKVEITGKVSEAHKEKKINLQNKDAIKIISSGNTVIPRRTKTGEVNESLEGILVQTSGQIKKSSGNIFYIDDGSGEIKVYLSKTSGLKKPDDFEKDKWVTVTGIVGQTTSGYRIQPRFESDLTLGKVAGISTSELPATGAKIYYLALFALLFALYVELPRFFYYLKQK